MRRDGDQSQPAGEVSPNEPPEQGSSPSSTDQIAAFHADMLSRERERDADSNAKTRPPGRERVTFRSITIAEMYAGESVDSLVVRLSKLKSTNSDYAVTEQIFKARMGYIYASESFWITTESDRLPWKWYTVTTIPIGIERIYVTLMVMGPSLIGAVFTFSLSAGEGTRIHDALNIDATSESFSSGNRNRIKTADAQKRERVQSIINTTEHRCRDWIKQHLPGILINLQEGPPTPTYALISLAQAKPFASDDGYMKAIGLGVAPRTYSFTGIGMRFFVRYLFGDDAKRVNLAAFSEKDLGRPLVIRNMVPEEFHLAVTSLLIADGLYALLCSYYPALRDIRSDLSKQDFDSTKPREFLALRTRLLKITPEISTICRETTLVTDDAVEIWASFRPLDPMRSMQSNPQKLNALWPHLIRKRSLEKQAVGESDKGITAEAKKRQLREAVLSLKSEESDLRELILVTTGSKSEAINLKLANNLRTLTVWLVVLTVVIVALTGATLYITYRANQLAANQGKSISTNLQSPTPTTAKVPPPSSPVPNRTASKPKPQNTNNKSR